MAGRYNLWCSWRWGKFRRNCNLVGRKENSFVGILSESVIDFPQTRLDNKTFDGRDSSAGLMATYRISFLPYHQFTALIQRVLKYNVGRLKVSRRRQFVNFRWIVEISLPRIKRISKIIREGKTCRESDRKAPLKSFWYIFSQCSPSSQVILSLPSWVTHWYL